MELNTMVYKQMIYIESNVDTCLKVQIKNFIKKSKTSSFAAETFKTKGVLVRGKSEKRCVWNSDKAAKDRQRKRGKQNDVRYQERTEVTSDCKVECSRRSLLFLCPKSNPQDAV